VENQKLVNTQTVNALLRLAVLFTALGFLIPLATLIFRFTDYYSWLEKVSPGHVVINPFSAICLMLLAVALALIRNKDHNGQLFTISYKTISNILCCICIVFCSSRLIFSIFSWPFPLDLLLFSDQLAIPEEANLQTPYNKMGVNTAFCLIMLSFSIIFIESKSNWFYSNPQTLNYLTIFISILTIYGYIYEVEDLYQALGKIPMSSISAICLLFLSTSVLFFRPFQGTMAHLIGQNPTQVFMMRAVAFVLPLLIGSLKIKGTEFDLFGEKFGTALMATTTYIISMTLLGWKTSIQYKLQASRIDRFRIIKKNRKELLRILNTSPTIIQILDVQTNKIIFTNELKKEGMLKKEEVLESSYDELLEPIHPDDIDEVKKRISKLLKLKDHEYNDITFRIQNSDKKITWLFNRAIVFKRKNGKPIQFLMSTIDITQLKEAEIDLQKKETELEEKLEELEKAKEKLKAANEKLKDKAKEQEEALVKSEKKYHDYIKNSYNGIIQFGHHGGDIDVNQPIDDYIKEVKEKTYIKEANKVAAKILDFNDPKDLEGIMFTEYTKETPEDEIDKNLKKFIESDFRLYGLEPIVIKEGGEKIRIYINILGIVKNNKLVKVWEIQSKSRIKQID